MTEWVEKCRRKGGGGERDMKMGREKTLVYQSVLALTRVQLFQRSNYGRIARLRQVALFGSRKQLIQRFVSKHFLSKPIRERHENGIYPTFSFFCWSPPHDMSSRPPLCHFHFLFCFFSLLSGIQSNGLQILMKLKSTLQSYQSTSRPQDTGVSCLKGGF